MQPQPTVHHRLPGIDARTVGAVVVRLEPLPRQQFRVRDQEIKLHPPLVGVLHPQDAVLIFIQSGHQNPLKARYQLFTNPGGQVLFRERQHSRGVFLRIRRGVDKLTHLLRLTLQYRRPWPRPVLTQQVIHRTAPATPATRMKFNDHRRTLSPAPCAAAAQARRRWPSAPPQSAPGHVRSPRSPSALSG